MPTEPLNIALWQSPYAPVDAGTAEAIRRLDISAAEAHAQGADVLICPEMSLTGYAIGAERVQALAEPPDGALAQSVSTIAQRHHIAIIYGYPELHPLAGKPFNATQAIAADGKIIGNYRKTHLFGDLDHQQFSEGDRPSKAFDYRGWRLGLLICYDVEFPETARMLALQGVDAALVPTANMCGFDEVPHILVPARACENRMYVAYANSCGKENSVLYGGLSTVANACGQLIATAERDEVLQVIQLSPDHLTSGRQHGYLPHRRPKLYTTLTVKE